MSVVNCNRTLKKFIIYYFFIDFLETIQVENSMGINRAPYSTYNQTFKFRSIVLPKISFDEKSK